MNETINASEKYQYRKFPCPEGFTTFNEDWFISEDGSIRASRAEYTIFSGELANDHWLLHLMSKRWFDANTFIPAYFEACRRRGLKVVPMRIEY